MRKLIKTLLILVTALSLSACTSDAGDSSYGRGTDIASVSESVDNAPVNTEFVTNQGSSIKINESCSVDTYNNSPYIIINDNKPFFTEEEYTTEAFENYSELDELGRCGVAYANICKELMPTEERGEIGQVKPSGWHTVKYDIVNGKYLYNRCHLIGYQLAGENANELNLITGTRYLNIDGMLEYENMVADYVNETDNHVLYRVTPIYTENNLVSDGVLMEAYSVEDNGEGVEFCVFAYNVQPGVNINYANGESCLSGEQLNTTEPEKRYTENKEGIVYILNIESKKYHLDTCRYAESMSEENKETFNGTKEWLADNGYEPCGVCKP